MVLSVEFPNHRTVIIVGSIFAIITNLLIVISGKKQDSETKSANLLIYAAIVNIVLEILLYIVPDLSISRYSEIELQFFVGYKIFRGLLFSIPYLLTFGLLFLIFGSKNREKFESNLQNAGIFWIISNAFKILYFNGEIITIVVVLEGYSSTTALSALIVGITIFLPASIAFALLINHGFNNDDKYLMWAGISSLGGFYGLALVGFLYAVIMATIL